MPLIEEGSISQSSKGFSRRLVFHDFDYVDPKSRIPRGGLDDFEMSSKKPNKNAVSAASFRPAFHAKRASRLPAIKGS